MERAHPLLGMPALTVIERAASEHRRRRWTSQGFTSLDDSASHPCGILRGAPFSVFAKLGAGPDAREQFTAELAGLRLISQAVPVPVPVAGGLADTEAGPLLLYEALPERPPESRSRADWRSIGQVLATLHQVRDERFGLDGPRGFFGRCPRTIGPSRGTSGPGSSGNGGSSRCCGPRRTPVTCRPAWPPGRSRSRPGCPRWPARSRGPVCCTETPSRTTSSAPRPARS